MPNVQWQHQEYDDQKASVIDFPATANYSQFGQDGIYFITYAGVPSTNFTDAGVGSLLVDLTNKELYIKTAAPDTWVVVGTQT
jgi:hypothetical protein